MLYQHDHSPYWRRHPVFVTAVAVLACWLFVQGWHVTLAVAALLTIAVMLTRRRRAVARRDAGLRARADYEHRLTLAGDPRGTYGRYPPVQAGWFRDPVYPRLMRYFDGSAWTPWVC